MTLLLTERFGFWENHENSLLGSGLEFLDSFATVLGRILAKTNLHIAGLYIRNHIST